MRVLASADVHGRRQVYDWLIATALEYRVDAVVLGGDLLGCPDGFATGFAFSCAGNLGPWP